MQKDINNIYKLMIVLSLIVFTVFLFTVREVYILKDTVNSKIIIDAECEEFVEYRRFARPQFFCYEGKDKFYTAEEKRLIQTFGLE